MSKLEKDTVLDNFTQAYTKANGKAPTVEAKGGWYSVDGGKNVRLAQLEEMTAELGSAKVAKKADKPVKKEAKPAAAQKAADKKEAETTKAPAAKKKTTAKKKAATKKPAKKKSKSTSFSVKDFYTQQIQEANAGAKAPR